MTVHYQDDSATLHLGDAARVLSTLETGSAQTIVTSPPYFALRSYLDEDHPDKDAEIGTETTPKQFVDSLVEVFDQAHRVLADDGTLWLNLGDSYATKTKGSGGTGRSTLGAESGGNAISEAGKLRSQKRQQIPVRKVEPGLPEKNLIGIPWRVAFALQDAGWILRSDIIWHKRNAMPSSVTDRPTPAHEYLFLLTKKPRYFYDADAIAEWSHGGAKGSRFDTGKTAIHQLGRAQAGERENAATRKAFELVREHRLTDEHLDALRIVELDDPNAPDPGANLVALASHAKKILGPYAEAILTSGKRNARTVWDIPTQPFAGAHFATMPVTLAERCIKAGSRPGDTVLDPFSGSGTTGLAAARLGRRYVGIDLNAEFLDLSLATRLAQPGLDLGVA